ncbi:MAG: hypothetical protein Q4C34_00600 [Bacteroidales bacterium]|nr:hypothetical protein [Bacteroidales bacterium]
MIRPTIIAVSALATVAAACSSQRQASAPAGPDTVAAAVPVLGSKPVGLPQAVIYTTSGDYDNLVPVTLSPDGKSIVSYPAPSDVSPETSAPLHVAHGYLLDRRGIGMYTAFTRYTYDRYAALPEAPSPEQLLDSIIPGARVTTMYSLPVTASEAAADTALVNRLIDEGRITPLMPQRIRPTVTHQ